MKTIAVNGKPTCIEETSTEDIVVACTDKGMYTIDRDSFHMSKIAEGTFSDICSSGGHLFAWDYQEAQLSEFVKDITQWKLKRIITAEFMKVGTIADTIIIKQNGNICIGSLRDHCIYELDKSGHLLNQSGSCSEEGDGCLSGPQICLIDSEDQVLVADQGHNKYKLLTNKGKWIRQMVATSNVYDIKIDSDNNTVWISQNGQSSCILTKYQIG